MGNLIITDTDFSYEFGAVLNNTPTSSASISEQAILQSIQHHNEDFFFSFETDEPDMDPPSISIPILMAYYRRLRM
jgi:hypothetical protein